MEQNSTFNPNWNLNMITILASDEESVAISNKL